MSMDESKKTVKGICYKIRCFLPVIFLTMAGTFGAVACFKPELWEIDGYNEFLLTTLTAGVALSNAVVADD